MWKEKGKKKGSDCHLNSEQDADKGAPHPCSPVSTVPGDLVSPDTWEQLEQHLQKRFLLQEQEHRGDLPHSIQLSLQLSLQLRLPDGQLPGVHQAQGGQGLRQLSAFTGKRSQDAEKTRSSCPARIPPRTRLGMDVGHSERRTLKHLCSGSASLPGKGLGVSCEESGRGLMRPSTSRSDKNVPRVHLNRTKGRVSEDHQDPVDGHPPRLASSLPGKSNVHREAKDPASPKDLEPCMNTCLEPSPLRAPAQQVLEAHIRKFQVRHRWGLPLRILKPIKAFKLSRAQHSTLLHSLSIFSATCASRALPNADFAKFLNKPVHSLPKENVKAESLFPTLVGPLSVPSLAWRQTQSALGRTPTGNCHGPSVAPLTRQEGRLPPLFLTYSSKGRIWHGEASTEAKEGCRVLSPSSAVTRNEPTKEDNRKAAPGEHREGLAGLRASQASGLRTAQEEKSVESSRSRSCQLEQKGQVPPENLFKKGMRRFLRWILPRKSKGQRNPLQKGTPAPAPAQSWEPGKSSSLVDNRAAEARVPMTAVRQSLEEKLAFHHRL
ncbi:spermatogenesis-associated protein 31A6-like [Sturnira hondurensis]|uniref:spermatogenesis-associated protein 31A6-like n=1 Tax=Sturnira hondurensis TaxID=192404 RepID=UPI001879B351|nr:spermatogenesis-associated protein 31A6-like [Sturnira hondurensis]